MAKNQVVTTDYRDLLRNLRDIKMNRTLPIFTMHVDKNGGLLPDKIPAHACWYYVTLAHKHLTRVEEGGTYVGDEDTVNSLYNIARSVAAFYNLESPAEMLKFMGDVRLEAIRCTYEWNDMVEEPLKSLFRRN